MQDDQLSPQTVFGTRPTRTNLEENWHREQERKSLDIIRVANPDDADFYVEWDHRFHRVPARGTADVPRYIAMAYCRDKAIDTINKMAEKLHKQDLEERAKKGMPAFKDKWEENQETYSTSRYPKTNDRELLAKLYGEYWVGLVSEFGKDMPMNTRANAGETLQDKMTPIEMKILSELQNRRVEISQAPVKEDVALPKFDSPAPVAKEELVSEVTQEDEAKDNTPKN